MMSTYQWMVNGSEMVNAGVCGDQQYRSLALIQLNYIDW